MAGLRGVLNLGCVGGVGWAKRGVLNLELRWALEQLVGLREVF